MYVYSLTPHPSLLPHLTIPFQTARILDAESGSVRVDMRDHDSVVETAIFVPPNAIEYIRQLVDFTVRLHLLPPSSVFHSLLYIMKKRKNDTDTDTS